MNSLTFSCDTCYKVYKLEKNLIKHKTTCVKTNKTAVYKCDLCPKIYKTEKNLLKHKLTCGKLTEGYKCPGCSKIMMNTSALTRHLSKCIQDINLTFNCSKCFKKYTTEDQLNKHLKVCQPKLEKGFNCICGRICKSVKGLNHHQVKCALADVNKNKYDMAKSTALANFFDEPNEDTVHTSYGEWYHEQQHGLCIYMAHNVYMTNKWAMFDLDGTLIKTKSGKAFGVSVSDWTLVNKDHHKKLSRLINKGFSIIIISNQACYKKDQRKLKEKFNQIQGLLEDIPVIGAFALEYNLYRKPNDRIIEYLESFLSTKMSRKDSFYVGDSCGRINDHSCCDRKFADNIGIPFHSIEKFIDADYDDDADKINWGFNPKDYLNVSEQAPILHEDLQELILLSGYPGSGKSTFAKKFLFSYTYVSKDSFKGTNLSPYIKTALSEGKKVVIDNTNLDVETRSFYINIAKDHDIPCKCYFFDLPLDLCYHLNHVRNVQSNNDIKVVPRVAYNVLKSKFVKPSVDEGFVEVINIPFIPNFDTEEDKKVFCKWTM